MEKIRQSEHVDQVKSKCTMKDEMMEDMRHTINERDPWLLPTEETRQNSSQGKLLFGENSTLVLVEDGEGVGGVFGCLIIERDHFAC